jgi:hypothetical protein
MFNENRKLKVGRFEEPKLNKICPKLLTPIFTQKNSSLRAFLFSRVCPEPTDQKVLKVNKDSLVTSGNPDRWE